MKEKMVVKLVVGLTPFDKDAAGNLILALVNFGKKVWIEENIRMMCPETVICFEV